MITIRAHRKDRDILAPPVKNHLVRASLRQFATAVVEVQNVYRLGENLFSGATECGGTTRRVTLDRADTDFENVLLLRLFTA